MMGAEKPAMGFPAGAEMDELEVVSPTSSTVPPPWKMR
jgi:hypothetical protein